MRNDWTAIDHKDLVFRRWIQDSLEDSAQLDALRIAGSRIGLGHFPAPFQQSMNPVEKQLTFLLRPIA